MSRQFIKLVALGPQGGESISHQKLIQCLSGWGQVWIATLSCLLDAFPHSQSVLSSLRMLNRVLQGFLPWLRHLQQGQHIRLLVWSFSRRDINIHCNPCTMETMVLSVFSLSEPLLSSLLAESMWLYTLLGWRRSQIACGGSWATRLTGMLSICFTCRLLESMLEVIVAVIYRNLLSIYSGCLNFSYRSCASLCISDVSKDWIVKNVIDIYGTVETKSKWFKSTEPMWKNHVH